MFQANGGEGLNELVNCARDHVVITSILRPAPSPYIA